MNIKMRQLRVFKSVVESGTVSGAADTLSLTQSSVSKTLAALEAELGFLLFDRIGRRLRLSHQGRLFYGRIENAIDTFTNIQTAAEDIRDNQGRRLRIAAIGPILFSRLVPKALARFSKMYPDYFFSVDMIVRIEIEDWTAQRNADLGFTLLPVETSQLNFRPVASGEIVAIVPKGHPLADRPKLSPKDVADEHIIMPGPGVRVRGLVETSFVEAGVNLRVRTQTTTMVSVVHLVASGLGIGIVDPFTVSGIDQRDIVVIPWEPALRLNYGVIWPKFRTLSRVEEEFIDIVRSVARDANLGDV